MSIITLLAILVNIIAIIVLSIGLFYNFVQPKNKAIFGYYVAGSMLIYLLLLGFVVICECFLDFDWSCLVLALCVISPFVIGKFVKYETLKKYTVIQIMFFVVSLVTLLLK